MEINNDCFHFNCKDWISIIFRSRFVVHITACIIALSQACDTAQKIQHPPPRSHVGNWIWRLTRGLSRAEITSSSLLVNQCSPCVNLIYITSLVCNGEIKMRGSQLIWHRFLAEPCAWTGTGQIEMTNWVFA